jgi:hypothetical protein
MTELVKYNEKNRVLFATLEASAGTYEAPAATEALAVMTLEGSITTETSSYEYLGGSLNRDEYSFITDSFADFSAETPQQILGALDAGITVAEVPFSQWYQACGGFVTVLASAMGCIPAGAAFIDNTQTSNERLSIDYRLDSNQDEDNQKLRQFYSCQGTMDITINLGDIPKCKFAVKGNAYAPIQAAILSPSFGSQFENVASDVAMASIVTTEIAERDGTFTAFGGTISTITKAANFATATTAAPHSLGSNGSIRFVKISGATDATYNGTFMIYILSTTTFMYRMIATPASNASGTFAMEVGPAAKTFCFGNTTAANFFGFQLDRYKTGCEVGYDKKAIATDVTTSILEGQAPATIITDIVSTTTTATVTANNHGMVEGNSVTISGVTGTDATYYNGTFTVLAGPTADTFQVTITSYAGHCTTAARAVNNSFATFDPDSHISDFFGVQIKFGNGAGEYVTYMWDKLQIKDVKEGKIETFLARDITFRNTGKSYILLS